MTSPGTITLALNQLQTGGAPGPGHPAVARIYSELRDLAEGELAREPAGRTLQPTDLVHRAYLKLFVPGKPWESRAHFFGAAARAMQQILVDAARRRRAARRALSAVRPSLAADQPEPTDLLDLSEAIQALQDHDPALADIVRLRLFAGLTVDETAAAMQIPARTLKRHYRFACAWLRKRLDDRGLGEGAPPDAG